MQMRVGWILTVGLLFGATAVRAAPSKPSAISCGYRGPSSVEELVAPDPDIERGQVLVERAECGRCHVLPATVAATPRQRSCAGCHAWIRGAREDATVAVRERKIYPLWDRYMATVSSFLDVPDLTASAARLAPDFMASYLRAPFKVRPTLHEGMIRTGFDADEARAVSAWLAAASSREWSPAARAAAYVALSSAPAHVEEGRRLYQALSCGTCHALGSQPASVAGPPAPDLGLVRVRMRPATLAAFIADPAAVGGETRMPRYPIGATEAARLRDYLWSRPVTHNPEPRVPGDVAVLDRPVRYEEVRAQVLDRICIHCHMDPKKNGGDGGPGNTGGLGYRGVGLDLETWAGIQRGALDAQGRRVSILKAPAGEEAPLVARLWRRYHEDVRERRGPAEVEAGGPPGMPLGLPPLTTEQFRLVRTWVAQGAPGPVTALSRKSGRSLKIARRPVEGPKQ
jgi:mono/diheme cytochrome c family protein